MPRHTLPSITILAFAIGCSGSAASKIRDNPKGVGEVMGGACGDVPAPWVIDLPEADANQLEREMKSGKLVLVSYDCKQLVITRGCEVALGDYDYGGLEYEAKHREMQDADEAKLALSGGAALAAKLSTEFSRGSVFRLDYAAAGRLSTTTDVVTRDMLKGKRCDKATHYVAAMDLGAYVLSSGAAAKIEAAAEIFGRGGSGKSNSEVKNEAHGGEPENCKRAGENDKEAPTGCKVPLLVQLYPIEAAESTTQTKPRRPPRRTGMYQPTCPKGRVVDEHGSCRERSKVSAGGYVCADNDLGDCRKQCNAGNPQSCAMLGEMLEKGEGTREDLKGAETAYRKACDRSIAAGCTGLAYVWSKNGDKAKAADAFAKGCAKGDGRACSGLGQQARLRKDFDTALVQFEKGCRNRYARACFYAASILGRQGRHDDARIAGLFKKACAGSDDRGCLGAGAMLEASGDSSGARLIDKGVKNLTAECDARKHESCEVLGDFYSGVLGKRSPDTAKAKRMYEKACAGGEEDACAKVAGKERPDPGARRSSESDTTRKKPPPTGSRRPPPRRR